MFKKILVASLLFVSVSAAYAGAYSSTHYVSLGMGVVATNHDWLGVDNANSGHASWNINTGYRFRNYLSAEVGFSQYYGKSDTATNVVDAAAKATYPLSDRFDLFGKLGLGYGFANGTTGFLPFIGLGVSYDLTPKLAIDLQYSGVTKVVDNVGAATLGLIYHLSA